MTDYRKTRTEVPLNQWFPDGWEDRKCPVCDGSAAIDQTAGIDERVRGTIRCEYCGHSEAYIRVNKIADTDNYVSQSDGSSDDSDETELHRLGTDRDIDKPGAARSVTEGVVVTCANCGFRNYIGVLLNTGGCAECGMEMEFYVAYGGGA